MALPPTAPSPVTRLINSAAHSPVIVAFIADGEPDHIYIGLPSYQLSYANIAGATSHDDHAMVTCR